VKVAALMVAIKGIGTRLTNGANLISAAII
jgi:hypothetical protein